MITSETRCSFNYGIQRQVRDVFKDLFSDNDLMSMCRATEIKICLLMTWIHIYLQKGNALRCGTAVSVKHQWLLFKENLSWLLVNIIYHPGFNVCKFLNVYQILFYWFIIFILKLTFNVILYMFLNLQYITLFTFLLY